jgi:hypothetical protein
VRLCMGDEEHRDRNSREAVQLGGQYRSEAHMYTNDSLSSIHNHQE